MTQQLEQPIQFGKYTLFERIGRGGMADVYKGRIKGPAGFERVFVVKRILPSLSDDPAFVRMFVEEAKLSARLNHPNIVQVFELGAVEGEYFISMEHVSGHDLAETMRALWKSSGAPRPELVSYIGREICRALGYAHGLTDERGQPLGMIHRDVSPSNVMLSDSGAVKLLDFGIAKALGDVPETTRSSTLKGKYAYMAPEQTEGENVDHRIDIFAAGIVMHEVLTGRRLFKGQNDAQTIERVRRCAVAPPSLANPACPPALDEILLRALARDPDDRFQTADEMADALDEVVHAAHFTPQQMAATLRQAFAPDRAVGAESGIFPSSRLTSSLTNPSVSVTSSSWRGSPTVPPVSIPRSRGQGEGQGTFGGGTTEAATVGDILPRPPWKRASFWLVALLCAGGITAALTAGVNGNGQRPSAAAPVQAVGAPGSSGARKAAKPVPILIQTEPEGADIYVAGKLESLGTTPRWVNLDLDPGAPARVMVRKAGFRDRAFAVEVEKPPVVQLIPIGAPDPVAAPSRMLPPAGGSLPPGVTAGTVGSGAFATGRAMAPRIVRLRSAPRQIAKSVKSHLEDAPPSPEPNEVLQEQLPGNSTPSEIEATPAPATPPTAPLPAAPVTLRPTGPATGTSPAGAPGAGEPSSGPPAPGSPAVSSTGSR